MKKAITNKLLWIFAVGQFGWSLLSGIIATWLVNLYTGNLKEGSTNALFKGFLTQHPLLLGITLFGLITAVGRIFDAVTDPLIASWSDRSNYKGGRRIPFMKAIAIPFALVTVGVFVLPTTKSIVANDIIIFVMLMPYVCPNIMLSRSVSLDLQASRIWAIFALPSFGTSESLADWRERTSSVASPKVSTIRFARTLPTPFMRPEAR